MHGSVIATLIATLVSVVLSIPTWSNSLLDDSGCSVVAIDFTGTLIVLGCPSADTLRGQVQTYMLRDGEWVADEQPLQPSDLDDAARFGYSLAMGFGKDLMFTLVVGAPYDNDEIGSVYVYTRSKDDEWVGEQRVTPDDNVGSALFGFSVALSSKATNTIVVGGPRDSYLRGAVWMYSSARADETWTQLSKVIVTSSSDGSEMGASVAMSEDGLQVCAGGRYDSGGIGAVWALSTAAADYWGDFKAVKLVGREYSDSHPSRGVGQGYAVAMNAAGNLVLSGGVYDRDGRGAVWTFSNEGTKWTENERLLEDTEVFGEAHVGSSVAISGDGKVMAVGGVYDDELVEEGRESRGAVWLWREGRAEPERLVVEDGVLLGSSLALSRDGSTLLVGGGQSKAGTGQVWLWTYRDQVVDPSDSSATRAPTVKAIKPTPQPTKKRPTPHKTPKKPIHPKRPAPHH